MISTINKAIVLGGSAGGVVWLYKMLRDLSPQFPYPLIIVIHRPDDVKSEMKSIFQAQSQLPVIEPEGRTKIENGTIYIAPQGRHIIVESDYTLNLDDSPLVQYSRPSIDILFMTAAEVFKNNLTGIIITGSNRDGAEGIKLIKEYGGTTIVQDPEEARLSRMPDAAINSTKIDYILSSEKILEHLNKLAS